MASMPLTGSQKPDLLLVEDNPHDLELALRAFQKNRIGNAIHVIRDGHEAIDYLLSIKDQTDRLRKTLKLIVLDLKLPKVNGIEVLKMIKSDDRLRSVPVVVFSSSQEDADILQCYSLGASSYIVKPVEFEQFIATVSALGAYWTSLNQSPA